MKTVKDVSEITGVSIRTFYNGENLIRNPADGAVGDVYVVEFFHMGFDIPGSHALCIHGEDFFFHVLCDGVLILFDELRLIVPVAVTGDSLLLLEMSYTYLSWNLVFQYIQSLYNTILYILPTHPSIPPSPLESSYSNVTSSSALT